MFTFKRDYMNWVCLKYEDPDTIGFFEPEWNDFDHLTEKTRMLHTTKRKHQPWKTGLPVDYRAADTFRLFPPKHWIRRARRALPCCAKKWRKTISATMLSRCWSAHRRWQHDFKGSEFQGVRVLEFSLCNS
jgi:hypothetical protein